MQKSFCVGIYTKVCYAAGRERLEQEWQTRKKFIDTGKK